MTRSTTRLIAPATAASTTPSVSPHWTATGQLSPGSSPSVGCPTPSGSESKSSENPGNRTGNAARVLAPSLAPETENKVCRRPNSRRFDAKPLNGLLTESPAGKTRLPKGCQGQISFDGPSSACGTRISPLSAIHSRWPKFPRRNGRVGRSFGPTCVPYTTGLILPKASLLGLRYDKTKLT